MDAFPAALKASGALTEDAARRIEELESRTHVPLARELHALLYLGALLILAGAGAVAKDHLEDIGPAAILGALGLGSAACFFYCVRLARPFTPAKAESPTAAFDYALYVACGLAGVFVSYLEFKFQLLGSWWDLYLFGSGLLLVALAYRYDNRLVLTTGLMNLAAFLGFRAERLVFGGGSVRWSLAAYGFALVGASFVARRSEVKAHFEGTYLQLGLHLGLGALLWDAAAFTHPEYWVLVAAAGAIGAWALREKRFDAFAPAVAYAYLATLFALLRFLSWSDFTMTLWIVVLSGGAAIAGLLYARARFKVAAS